MGFKDYIIQRNYPKNKTYIIQRNYPKNKKTNMETEMIGLFLFPVFVGFCGFCAKQMKKRAEDADFFLSKMV
jgi:hypothetical protein